MMINTANITNFISYPNSRRCNRGETFDIGCIIHHGWNQINIDDAHDCTQCSFFALSLPDSFSQWKLGHSSSKY
jgi:hypothetical protein